jgi:hypothetical protein
VAGKRYEVLAIRAPAGLPVAAGAVFPLEETCCASALASDRPVALAGVRGASPPPNAFRFQAYLGTALTAGDRRVAAPPRRRPAST